MGRRDLKREGDGMMARFSKGDATAREGIVKKVMVVMLALLLSAIGAFGLRSAMDRVADESLSIATGKYAYDSMAVEESAAFDANGLQSVVGYDGSDMVRSGGASFETRRYDAAVANLKAYVNEHGGGVEHVSESKAGEGRYLSLFVSVPADGFDEFVEGLSSVDGLSLVSLDIDMSSVAKQRSGIERRVAFLEESYASYEGMLAEAKESGDLALMMEIQNAMLSIAGQLDDYGASLDDLDESVATSTAYLSVSELSETVEVEKDFGEKVSEAARNGWARFVNGLSEMAIGIVGAWPVVLLIVVGGTAVGALGRKAGKKSASSRGDSEDSVAEAEDSVAETKENG